VKELRARRTGRAEGRVLESRVDKGRGCDINLISRVFSARYLRTPRSPVATILVTQGCLETGSYAITGTTWARVWQITDSSGASVRNATPRFPITLSGWKDLPQAGDEVLEGKEDEVKNAVYNRKRNIPLRVLQEDVAQINEKHMETKEALREPVMSESRVPASSEASLATDVVTDSPPVENNVKELRLIVKGDVNGSVEAVVGAIEGI
jgi:translation initiation factor IF-2